MSIVKEIFEQFIPQLSNAEKEELLTALIMVIDKELVERITDNSERDVCPRCGGLTIIKKGRPKGCQRYLCQECKKIFSSSTNRIMALSKLPRETWVEYARSMMDMLTLRESALRCGVCLKTSFFMRVRICECMRGYLDPFRVGPSCSAEIDEIYLRESFKGNHTRSTDFVMPRKAKRRPSDGVRGGTTKDLICILSGINDRGSVFLEVATMGRFCLEDAKRMLHGKICEGAIISTDDHHAYKKALKEIGVAIHNHYKVSERSDGVINAINSVHARLRNFLKRFGGISSRWIEHYLVWFKWMESFRLRSNKECSKKAVGHIANGYYETRMRDCWKKPYLFERFSNGYFLV